MTTITIQAIYRGGVLELAGKLDLPENTPVRVMVTPMPVANPQQPSSFASLRGIWSHVEFLDSIEDTLRKIRAQSSVLLTCAR